MWYNNSDIFGFFESYTQKGDKFSYKSFIHDIVEPFGNHRHKLVHNSKRLMRQKLLKLSNDRLTHDWLRYFVELTSTKKIPLMKNK